MRLPQTINRTKLPMLLPNISLRQRYVPIRHVQARVTKQLLQRKDITSVSQKGYSERVPKRMGRTPDSS
jgi:hypothetical protein